MKELNGTVLPFFLMTKIKILVGLADFRAQIRSRDLQKMKPTSRQVTQDVGSLSGIMIYL
jgi:hypothetical protein